MYEGDIYNKCLLLVENCLMLRTFAQAVPSTTRAEETKPDRRSEAETSSHDTDDI